MQRVKVLGGSLSADQWRALAGIARLFTPTAPLHLTTRQDVELHDVPEASVPAVQAALAEAGLTGLGACGDTLRNITVCPCSGTPGRPDLTELAWQVRRTLMSFPALYELPRKFKVSLSACPEACGQPFINDLGFVACQRDGRWRLRAIGAGSLGPRPATGIVLREDLDPSQASPFALAALTVFAECGDRTNRSRARLRHVRQAMGDEAFLKLLEDRFTACKKRRWPAVKLSAMPAAEPLERLTLTFPNGDVTPAMAEALATLIDRGLILRITNSHQVAAFCTYAPAVTRELLNYVGLAEHAKPRPAVIACPGSRWCSRGLVDTNAMAERMEAMLAGPSFPLLTDEAGSSGHNARICISGCPNGCAHSTVADVGLIGVLTRNEQGPQEAWNLFLRGGNGFTDALAQPAGNKLSTDQVKFSLSNRR